MEDPGAFGTGHDIEIIEVVAVRCADRVIAFRHHHHVAILHRHGFVEAAIVGVDALKGEALGRVDAVVVGFLEPGLGRRGIAVVLVRRVAGTKGTDLFVASSYRSDR